VGPAVVAAVDGPVAVDRAAGDRAVGDLVGGVPPAGVASGGEAPAAPLIAPAEAQHADPPPVVVGNLPRAVGVVRLPGVQEVAAAHARGAREERAAEAVPAALELEQGPVEDVEVIHVDRPRRREVALLRVVGPLLVLHAGDELGDEEVVVRVALAVGVRGHVRRDSGHPGREVGAVVDVEAADVVLVRLPLAAVLADDDPGYRLEHLGRPVHRPPLHLLAAHDALRARAREAEETVDRLVEVGEVAESPAAGDEHVRVQGDAERHVQTRPVRRLDVYGADGGGEAGEAKVQPVASRREVGSREGPVGARGQGAIDTPGEGTQAHGHAGERSAGLVPGYALDPAIGLRVGEGGAEEEHGQDETSGSPHHVTSVGPPEALGREGPGFTFSATSPTRPADFASRLRFARPLRAGLHPYENPDVDHTEAPWSSRGSAWRSRRGC
jgi:hypothetical protein